MAIHNIAKQTVLTLAISALALFASTAASAASTASDIEGHWAETRLTKWVEQDLLKGFNGSYDPDRAITRGEFIALINRSFGLDDAADISFRDLDNSHWAYNHVEIALKAGYVNGYSDHTIRVNQTIAREEAAVMVSKLLGGGTEAAGTINLFRDAAAISAWSRQSVADLAGKSILTGNGAGDFNPQGKLTRAEAVTILDKAIDFANSQDTVYDKPGSFGPSIGTQTIKGNVVVSSPGVTLRNLDIEGDLTLTDGIGEGEAFFKKVNVNGSTSVQGGGADSVHFENSTLKALTIEKKSGTVRVAVTGHSVIGHTTILSPSKLEESNVTGGGFGQVELSASLPAGSQVDFKGSFEEVAVKSAGLKISLTAGSIQRLNVESAGAGAEITLQTGASVSELVLDAVAKLAGSGSISNATVNGAAKGSSFQTRPAKVSGEGASPAPAAPANTGGGSPGGGSIGGGPVAGGDNGGNPGGGNGGNPGGGNGGNPGSGGEEVDDSDASLKGISLSKFTLGQLNSEQYTVGKGFDADVHSYSIVTEWDMEPTTLSISLDKPATAMIEYVIWSKSGTEKSSTLHGESQFDVNLNAKEEKIVNIKVTSGDRKNTRQYDLFIQYPRTAQEALRLSKIGGIPGAPTGYIFQKGSFNGQKLQSSDTIKLYNAQNNELFHDGQNQLIPLEQFAEQSGLWNIEVYRGDTLLGSDQYHYDLTTALVVNQDIGLIAAPYTKQELVAKFESSEQPQDPYCFGYQVSVDSQKLQAVIPQAKYFSYWAREMTGKVTALHPGLTFEELKINTLPDGFFIDWEQHIRVFPLDSQRERTTLYSHYSGPIRYGNPDVVIDNTVNDMFIIVGFYDENYQFLGQAITVVQFDENTVADGYTPAKNWQPESGN